MKTFAGALSILLGLVMMAVAQPPQGSALGSNAGTQYGTPGMGGPGGPPPNAMPNAIFNAIDTDGDGAITTRELRKAVVALKQFDADKDGKITQDEVSGGPPNPQAMIDRAMENDKNGDGKLSKAELPRHLAHALGNADANGDGSIDRAELTAAIQSSRPQFGGTGGGAGGFRGAGGLTGDPRPGGPNLSQFDRNGDGQLSADEMPNQLRGMLHGSDQNGDGKLDMAELKAIQQRLNERVRGQRALPPGVNSGPQGVSGLPKQQ